MRKFYEIKVAGRRAADSPFTAELSGEFADVTSVLRCIFRLGGRVGKSHGVDFDQNMRLKGHVSQDLSIVEVTETEVRGALVEVPVEKATGFAVKFKIMDEWFVGTANGRPYPVKPTGEDGTEVTVLPTFADAARVLLNPNLGSYNQYVDKTAWIVGVQQTPPTKKCEERVVA
jgi:hypothetical protein